jgi:methionyl aminopeptidase
MAHVLSPGPAVVPTPVPKANDSCWCGSGRKYKRCHKQSQEPVRRGRLSPARTVPVAIPRPAYAASGEPAKTDEPMVKSPEVIERMRRAGRAAAEVLAAVGALVAPGVTTDELDARAHEECIARGGYPSPLNYHFFPKSLCTSVNEVICHGIPDDRALVDGDIVNLDVTIFLDGVHGDTNATFLVGDVDEASKRLVDVARRCMYEGIAAVRPGRPISDIGAAIEAMAHGAGYGVVQAFVGHGIGEQFHMAPNVPHYFDPSAPSAATIMEPGMTFTVEPMITMGTWQHRMWDDGWTAVTADRRRTAQFEHTLVVTTEGADILTRLDD